MYIPVLYLLRREADRQVEPAIDRASIKLAHAEGMLAPNLLCIVSAAQVANSVIAAKAFRLSSPHIMGKQKLLELDIINLPARTVHGFEVVHSTHTIVAAYVS